MKNNNEIPIYVYIIGLIPVIWIALLIAPSFSGGLVKIINDFPIALDNPFKINWCDYSLRIVLLFVRLL